MATDALFHSAIAPTRSTTVAGDQPSGGQVVVNGSGVNFNISSSHIQALSMNQGSSSHAGSSKDQSKPFVLKLKTKQIRICQSCRKDYEGANDTMGLVVARAERRLVSNLATGVQFFGRESNSHYHALKSCIVKADASFTGPKLVIPPDVKVKLNEYQKVYLCTCLEVPFEALDMYMYI